jgi:hypothetical protein
MKKYGIEHFHIELLEETNNPSEREIYWIEQKQSFKYGYNATLGGDGKKYIDYDLVFSTYQALQNISETAKKLQISIDSVTKIVKQKGEIKSSSEVLRTQCSKAVKMFDKNTKIYIQSFSSLTEAAQYLKDNHYTVSTDLKGVATHIRQCANKQRKTAYNFIWEW